MLNEMEGVRRAAAQRRSSPPPGTTKSGRRRAFQPPAIAPLVLLVDDHHDTRDMYAEYLAHAGLRVVQATDGDHGLWKILALRPDVVVMDLGMPVVDGWEATRQIKSRAKTRFTPVIALTGHVGPDHLRRAADAGADAVLTKPCAPDELHRIIQELLGR